MPHDPETRYAKSGGSLGAGERAAQALRADGFEPEPPDLDGYAFRYSRDGLIVDLLAPDGVKPPPALGTGRVAIGVPGGSQARICCCCFRSSRIPEPWPAI